MVDLVSTCVSGGARVVVVRSSFSPPIKPFNGNFISQDENPHDGGRPVEVYVLSIEGVRRCEAS